LAFCIWLLAFLAVGCWLFAFGFLPLVVGCCQKLKAKKTHYEKSTFEEFFFYCYISSIIHN